MFKRTLLLPHNIVGTGQCIVYCEITLQRSFVFKSKHTVNTGENIIFVLNKFMFARYPNFKILCAYTRSVTVCFAIKFSIELAIIKKRVFTSIQFGQLGLELEVT